MKWQFVFTTSEMFNAQCSMVNFSILMEQVIYKILNRINVNNDPVTWYQLDRMFRSNNLHSYLKDLTSILNKLENDGLIV